MQYHLIETNHLKGTIAPAGANASKGTIALEGANVPKGTITLEGANVLKKITFFRSFIPFNVWGNVLVHHLS